MEMLGRGTLGHERQSVEMVGNQKSRKVEELWVNKGSGAEDKRSRTSSIATS